MTERNPIPMKDIPEFIRSGRHLSPALQKIADENRRQVEASRAVVRDIIEGAQRQMAAAFNVDLRKFAKVPDDVIERLIADGIAMRSVAEFHEAKLNISFASEVTVNNVRLPDEDKE